MTFKINTENKFKLRNNWVIIGKVVKSTKDTIEIEIYENFHMNISTDDIFTSYNNSEYTEGNYKYNDTIFK